MSNSKLVYSTDSNLEPYSDVCEQDINIAISQQKIRLHLDRKKGGKINTIIRGLILKNDDLKSFVREIKKKCASASDARFSWIPMRPLILIMILSLTYTPSASVRQDSLIA